MKHTIAFIGLSALTLSGCAAIQAYITPEAQQIIADAKATCNFVMNDVSAIGLIPIFGPDAQAAATAVCDVVNALPNTQAARMARGGEITIIVRGVKVVGYRM